MENGIIDAIIAILIALFGHVAQGDNHRLGDIGDNMGLKPPAIAQRERR